METNQNTIDEVSDQQQGQEMETESCDTLQHQAESNAHLLNCVPPNEKKVATTPQNVVDKNDSGMIPAKSDGASHSANMLGADGGLEQCKINPDVRIRMLARVALSDAHFKHQQRGEPELTMDEKIEIAQIVLDTNKVTFLARFGEFLELEDLEYFQEYQNVYEVDFYVKQIMKRKSGNYERNRVKNRRYEAMKDLTMKGEYFSEDEMKFRNPYLYEQMVGQYLTDEEIQAKVDKTDLRFSTILIQHIDQLDENRRFYRDKDKEEGQEEEEEEEDDDKDSEESEMEDEEDPTKKKDNKPKISNEEKQELKAEFLTLMQEKFLRGEDKQFDYSKVDNNEAYDDLTVLNHDAEEKYFDDEDEASIHSDCG